jgi:hypothetical protein
MIFHKTIKKTIIIYKIKKNRSQNGVGGFEFKKVSLALPRMSKE